MDIAAVASAGGATIGGVFAYLRWKAHRLPSKREIRAEIEDRLSGEHEIPTPLAARRHDEIEWSGDFYITVENVEVSERKARRKWLPRQGFSGKTLLEFKFHGRKAPSEKKFYDSFLGKHGQFERINRHVDDPYRLNILVGTANPDTVCGHIIGTFKRIIMELKFKEDNPDVDDEWLTHPKNTYLGHKNGNLYDIMGERVVLPIMYLKGQERPDNIPPKPKKLEEDTA